MTPQEQNLLDTALLAANATHRYWLATDAICEAIFEGDAQEVGHSMRANGNIEAYAKQSKELSAKVTGLSEDWFLNPPKTIEGPQPRICETTNLGRPCFTRATWRVSGQAIRSHVCCDGCRVAWEAAYHAIDVVFEPIEG